MNRTRLLIALVVGVALSLAALVQVAQADPGEGWGGGVAPVLPEAEVRYDG